MSETCPLCAADLRGAPIPQEYLDRGLYSSGSTHYSRIIGHEVSGVYDGVLFWSCPDCGGAWHRWPEKSRTRAAAQSYVDAVNAAVAVR